MTFIKAYRVTESLFIAVVSEGIPSFCLPVDLHSRAGDDRKHGENGFFTAKKGTFIHETIPTIFNDA